MSKNVIVPMDSYRLASYAVPVGCYICDGDNNFDADVCRHCGAPMALARQIKDQKVVPAMLSVLGASGAGKTVYLGMLMDMLSRQPEKFQLLARGAFSVTLQQTTVAALAHCEFPEKTPNEPDRWNWVHCQIGWPKPRRPVELIVPDMAGDSVAQEIENSGTFPVIQSFLSKGAGTMILVDSAKLRGGHREQDHFTMKLASYLAELPKIGAAWSAKPVAVVFTKADRCEACARDPEAYAKTHAIGLWQQCRERFTHYKFFAASVAGACGYRQRRGEARTQIPLRIEPHGIFEPFLWLLQELWRSGALRKKKKQGSANP